MSTDAEVEYCLIVDGRVVTRRWSGDLSRAEVAGREALRVIERRDGTLVLPGSGPWAFVTRETVQAVGAAVLAGAPDGSVLMWARFSCPLEEKPFRLTLADARWIGRL